jgi:hypothetical protein
MGGSQGAEKDQGLPDLFIVDLPSPLVFSERFAPDD